MGRKQSRTMVLSALAACPSELGSYQYRIWVLRAARLNRSPVRSSPKRWRLWNRFRRLPEMVFVVRPFCEDRLAADRFLLWSGFTVVWCRGRKPTSGSMRSAQSFAISSRGLCDCCDHVTKPQRGPPIARLSRGCARCRRPRPSICRTWTRRASSSSGVAAVATWPSKLPPRLTSRPSPRKNRQAWYSPEL